MEILACRTTSKYMGCELISIDELLISYLQYSSKPLLVICIPPTALNYDAYNCSLIVGHVILSLTFNNIDTI